MARSQVSPERTEGLQTEGPVIPDSSSTSPHSNQADQEAGRQLEPSIGEHKEPQERSISTDRHFLLKADAPNTAVSRLLRHFAILGLLMFTAIWGTLTREGLVALNTYSGSSIEPTIWAQAVGCLVMGWAVANKEALERWYPPAYIAIGTGYCGSVTTFSSWILHVFQAYGNQRHYDRHGLHNVMDALTQTAATIGMSLISLAAGHALKAVIPAQPILHFLEHRTVHKALLRRSTSPNTTADHENGSKGKPLDVNTQLPYTTFPDLFSILLGITFWAASAILCGTYRPFRRVTYAIVLAPPGTILRWYLSRLNTHPRSKRAPFWPLGTLAANLAATAVLSAAFVGQNVGRVSGIGARGAYTYDACNALYGLQEGFCGCLSTISTFAVELTNMKPTRRAVSYAIGSYVLGIAICVLLIGAPWWSIGMDGSCKGLTL